MKKIHVLLLSFLLTGALQAQIEGIPSKSEFQKTFSKLLKNNKQSLPTEAVLKLSKYYKADDGSIIAIRQIGDKIYAIADRYDRRFASVLTGTITSQGLKVNYHYIPKGKAKGSGTLYFKRSGTQLVLDASRSDAFNFTTLTTLNKLPIKLPIDDRAWYRGNTANNLTGRYKVDNVGKDYVLDLGKKIIMYSVGGRETSHKRPQFATLFFGDRNGKNITGYYIDVPYGHTDGMGKASFNLVGQHYLRASYDHFYYGVQRVRQLDDIKEILK